MIEMSIKAAIQNNITLPLFPRGAEDWNNCKFTFLFFCKLGPSGVVEIIEKRPGPLRIKFNPKWTPIILSEVDYQFIEKYHVNHCSSYQFATIFFSQACSDLN